MQNVFQEFFIDRTLYYSTFSIQNMAKKDTTEEGRWNFELQRLYSVNLLNFTFKEKEKETSDGQGGKEIVEEISEDDLLHCVMLKNIKTNKIFFDKLVFIYLEMPKFKKPIEECKTFYEKWLFVLQNLTRLMERPKELQERVFKRLFEQAEIAAYSTEEYNAYQESLKNLWDMANSNEAAEKKGFNKGKQLGIEEGKQLGIEEGKQLGIEEGKLAIARRLKAANLDIAFIAETTGLTIDDIKAL